MKQFSAGTLTGEERTDEDGHCVRVFKDLLGNTVLEPRNNDTYLRLLQRTAAFRADAWLPDGGGTGQYYRYDYDTKECQVLLRRWLRQHHSYISQIFTFPA